MDGKNISVKAYLQGENGSQEIRRFGLDASAATSFSYLQGKLRVVFPSLLRQQFNVRWEDADGDSITISSDEELLVALVNLLQVGGQQTLRLHVVPSRPSRAEPAADGPVHQGISCDGCEQTICGHRYKCMTCEDYDLCAGCEARSLHPEHMMLRIPTPDRAWQPVFRQAQRINRRGQCPAAWGGVFGMPGGPHCGRFERHTEKRAEKAEHKAEKRAERAEHKAEKRAERCAERAERWAERAAQRNAAAAEGSGAAGPQPSNFFEAIHSAMSALGGFAPEGAAAQGATAGRWTEKSLEELGQTIAACLDPFGIDVDVGVETRQKRAEEANGQQRPTAAAAAGQASAQQIATAATNAAKAATAAAAAAAVRAASAAAAATAATATTVANAANAAAAATAPAPAPARALTPAPAPAESMEAEPAAVADGVPSQTEPAAAAPAERVIPVTLEDLPNDPADDWTMVSGASTPSEASGGARSRVYPDLAAEAPTAATPVPTPPTATTPVPTPSQVATPVPTPPQAATPVPTEPTPTAAAATEPSAPELAVSLEPRVQRALDAMSAMGFTNDGGWLTNLLQAKDGDISAVLDVLQPVPRRGQ